jgi:hypothetical protein
MNFKWFLSFCEPEKSSCVVVGMHFYCLCSVNGHNRSMNAVLVVFDAWG